MTDLDDQSDEVRSGKGRRSGGAVLEFHDARVSKIMAWFFGAMGMTIVTLLGIAANNLYDLNMTVARGMDADLARDVRINDHEARLRQVEKDINEVQGKIFRGVDGYGTDNANGYGSKEPKHGK